MADTLGPGARVMRSTGLPYYLQIAAVLRDEIAAGTWEPGRLIPSEADLCSLFGVSRTAIRQALGELVADGLLVKEKGRGTFVRRPRVSLAVQELRGFFEEMTDQGREVDTDLRRQEVVAAPPEVAAALGLAMGSDVLCVERVRSVGGTPLVHVLTYLPLDRFARLLDIDLTRRSLYAVLAEEFDVRAAGGHRRIDAVAADRSVARLLGVPSKSPVLRVTAVNTDERDLPFEYFDAAYRADQTSFEIVVTSGALIG